MANTTLPSYTAKVTGDQVTATEFNDIRDRLTSLIGHVWQTVSASGTTAIGTTTDVVVVTATGSVTLTTPTGYAGRKVVILKTAAAVGGITLSGSVGDGLNGVELSGSPSSVLLGYEIEWDGTAWRLIRGYSTVADGSVTATSLDAGLTSKLGKLGSAGSYISNIQTVSTASATVSADVDLVLVTYAGGTCALTFGDSTGFPVGRSCIVQKANTSSNGITVVADGATQVNGGTAGVAMTLPNSTTACSTTTADPAYLVQRTGTTAVRVS